ncbi:Pyridoxamine 5'-phosphate oxidase-related, FMN-binding [Desulfurella amilsii]|uniref:Pyridoxamine 5'-phosphate oxidase-related, FMN-binding n=1 Tax=Desulfurella amilsii TaxID=1562698 RepID=A0A1X4XW77_9BACT|nr:hypothetical protein [Desulfurella amilsii]OSS41792.1 Pyridoxamine 5'-phosphate oxidase-related, FMN-binding [Desulfurella amilsii]
MNEKILEILKYEGPAPFVTNGRDGVHMVSTWNSYIEVEDNNFLIPVGGLYKTQENIQNGGEVQMIIGSKEVMGISHMGAGFLLKGTAVFEFEGKRFEKTKSRFEWARAVMVFHINEEYELI